MGAIPSSRFDLGDGVSVKFDVQSGPRSADLEQKLAAQVKEELIRNGMRPTENAAPKYVYNPQDGYGYGTTVLTYDGPVNMGRPPIRPDYASGYKSGMDPFLDLGSYLLPE